MVADVSEVLARVEGVVRRIDRVAQLDAELEGSPLWGALREGAAPDSEESLLCGAVEATRGLRGRLRAALMECIAEMRSVVGPSFANVTDHYANLDQLEAGLLDQEQGLRRLVARFAPPALKRDGGRKAPN